MGTLSEMSINILDLSYFDRNHFIIFPKPPLRPSSSQDVKHGIIISGVETSLWQDFIQRLEGEFDGDYDPVEEKLCVYFHQGPRIDQGIWDRVWALTDDTRPLELAKLDIAIVPRVLPPLSNLTQSTTRVSDVSSLTNVSQFLSDLTSNPPPSQPSVQEGDHCCVLPRFLTEITPRDSVSQISSSIPSEEVSLISKAEKDALQWKARQLDAIAKELRAIQIGSKAGLSTATIRDILGDIPAQKNQVQQSESREGSEWSLMTIATSTAIPAVLCLALITLSLKSSSIPSLHNLHRFLTSSSSVPAPATVIYRAARPAGLSPHNLTFLVPFLVVGSAIVGWNVLTKELGIEFEWIGGGKDGVWMQLIHGVEEWDVDWDGVREFFGMVEGNLL